MSQIETIRSDVEKSERLLHDDELDAVSGGHRSAGDKVNYMEKLYGGSINQLQSASIYPSL